MIIVALIVAVLYPFVIKLIEKNDIQLLKETTDTNIAIEIRKKLKRNRIIILILMLILYAIFEVITTIVITNFEDPQNIVDLIRNIGLTGVAMYIYLRKQNAVLIIVDVKNKSVFIKPAKKFPFYKIDSLKIYGGKPAYRIYLNDDVDKFIPIENVHMFF